METTFKLLMVEDSPEDAELLLRTLRKGGLAPQSQRVQTAEALLEALAKDRWDVVISDFSMPGFDGSKALAIVHEADADLPFLFFSGTLEVEVAVEAMRQGASDYFLKGHWNHLTRLAPAVRREVEKRETRRRLKEALAQPQPPADADFFAAGWPWLGEFAGSLQRELAEPLGRLSREAWLLDASEGSHLSKLKRQLEGLHARMGTLDTFRRLRRAGGGSTDLNATAATVADFLGLQRCGGVEVVQKLERGLPFVLADPAHVHQIFINLGMEMLQSGDSDGPIEIETGRLLIGADWRSGQGSRTREYGMLRLRDLGDRSEPALPGIKAALAEALTLHNGGQFTVENLDGARCFRVCFPLWQAGA
ncbi:MAG TPA: response regulator [bacterium]|nr:response regulator [bacterium]